MATTMLFVFYIF